MSGEDLFCGLNYVSETYVEEAETVTQLQVEKRMLSLHRSALVAALIALLLMLVGCAVYYVLNLSGLKLGDQTGTRDVYEYDPSSGEAIAYVGQETYVQQVLTLAGLDGTPASQAAREWYEFCEAYDPDREIQRSVWGNFPEFPAEYAGYGLYTQEMKDKLDEILKKYDLKLRGQKIEFQTGKLLFRALGMENVLNSDSEAGMRVNHTAYYENGNLDVYFDITIPGENGVAAETTTGYLFYRPKECFIPDTAILTDAQWEEWNYTTASGHNTLIVSSADAGTAWIFCDMPNYTASLRLDTIRRMATEKGSGGQTAEFDSS